MAKSPERDTVSIRRPGGRGRSVGAPSRQGRPGATERRKAARHLARAVPDVRGHVPARRTATDVLLAAEQLALVPQSITLTAPGGIALWFRTGADYILVECYDDGTSSVLWDAPGEAPLNWTINCDGPLHLRESLTRIKQRLEGAKLG